jgi:hypothetical protein
MTDPRRLRSGAELTKILRSKLNNYVFWRVADWLDYQVMDIRLRIVDALCVARAGD